MNAQQTKLTFSTLGSRRVEADFSAGYVTSDAGALLLRQADERLGLTRRLGRCFTDYRRQDLIEHSVTELLAQRIYGLALGYEDLNDHDRLNRDPLLSALAGKLDPEGKTRRRPPDRGKALASSSTLGRIERTKANASSASRYEKVVCDFDRLQQLFVQLFIDSFDQAPVQLVLDVDPTDIELHGQQEQRFYHGYYRHYCYLPMYLFCGQFPLAVKLRPANIDGSAGVVELLSPVVEQLRDAFADVHLIVRADSGFCRDELMSWCEDRGIDYVIGIPRNSRLVGAIEKQIEQARRKHLHTGKSARCFRDLHYRTHKSWSRKRRLVAKAEYMDKGPNPRFVVTSLPARLYEKRYLYEVLYCARGEMENRIKEQLSLFADRASCHAFRANEIRLWWAMAAHILVLTVRRFGLKATKLQTAQASTLRNSLFKIGALVTISVRRVYIQRASAFPLRELFATVVARLSLPPPVT